MMINSLNTILLKRIRHRSLVLTAFLTVYAAFLMFVFFQGVKPSLANGTTNQEFAVDSTIYMDIAESLKAGDATGASALLSFPNTIVTPVAIYFVLGNAFYVLCFNCVIFIVSIALLSRSFSFSLDYFMLLLLLNPTTTSSLLCLNKEIIDLLVISTFFYSIKHRKLILRIFSLTLALLNRYEICVVLLVYIAATGRVNPFRKHRFLTLLVLVVALTLAVPFFASNMLSSRFQEAKYGGVVAKLDSLQMHYLYIVAVVPKIAETLIGQLLNSEVWKAGAGPEADNAPWLRFMFFNNLANVMIIAVLFKQHMLRLKNELVYCGALGAVLVAQSLAIQPRYFYFIYVLFCLQAAMVSTPSITPLVQREGTLVNA